VEYLKELANRADLGSLWASWSTQYRVIAVIVGLLAAYLVVRSIVPAVLRMLRPALLIVIVLLGVWALFPAETCSIDVLARLPLLCRR
jgi:multisubunit Na+/H+ antiporter MnhE subunit